MPRKKPFSDTALKLKIHSYRAYMIALLEERHDELEALVSKATGIRLTHEAIVKVHINLSDSSDRIFDYEDIEKLVADNTAPDAGPRLKDHLYNLTELVKAELLLGQLRRKDITDLGLYALLLEAQLVTYELQQAMWLEAGGTNLLRERGIKRGRKFESLYHAIKNHLLADGLSPNLPNKMDTEFCNHVLRSLLKLNSGGWKLVKIQSGGYKFVPTSGDSRKSKSKRSASVEFDGEPRTVRRYLKSAFS